tara:strand:- start:146 stop:340 length:195 start_codon:yes stop_codon:yes gene_type:complete
MYNCVDFGEQLKNARRRLWGNRDPRDVSQRFSGRYVPPSDVEMIRCVEDTNGEWVPERDEEIRD